MSSKYITLKLYFGETVIEISKNSVYRLLAGGLTGTESPDYSAATEENALIDGSYVVAEKFSPRSIDINFCVTDLANSEIYRSHLISAIDPQKAGSLVIERNGVSRKINFIVNGSPSFTQKNIFTDRLHVSVSLFCPDPWFYDSEEHESDMVETVPLLTFPFNSLQGVGIASGTTGRSDSVNINNTGDGPIGIIAEITANGSIQNPYIMCGGKYVKALCNMVSNDVIEFSTIQRKKDIRLNGESLVNYDRKSVFFELPIGTSTLQFGATNGAENATVKIRYSLKYLGV